MPHLVLFRDGTEILRVVLDRSEMVIGRGEDAHILLSDDGISRKHASLRNEDGRWLIFNHSRNRTLLENEPVAETGARLSDGSRITLGPFKAVFRMDQARSSEATRTVSHEHTKLVAVDGGGHKMVVERTVLEAVGGPDQGRKWPLNQERYVIGKAAGCDVELTDTYASAQHFRLAAKPVGWLLKDLGSTNGTLVNGMKVVEGIVTPGAEIRIGKTVLRLVAEKQEKDLPQVLGPIYEGMFGKGPRMREVFTLIEAVAGAAAPVLILGESGTGKELVARAIHNRSRRADKPYVALNAGAISPTLVESELFGHEKGAFTGADRRRLGAFERAHEGTLFLDEVGELSMDLQTKLLRVLETGEILRVGGSEPVQADVRLVAATNKDLAAMVRQKKFREDLYFRLYVVPIRLPALRERPEDLEELIEYLLKGMSPGGRTVQLSPEALAMLKGHDWPGNVRELKNTLTRATVLAGGGTIDHNFIHFTPLSAPSLVDASRSAMESSERETILAALKATKYNRRKAAEMLGIARSTLQDKLKKHGIRVAGNAEGDGES